MRLRNLSLDRFGHFTDQHFDFGEVNGTPDFHIIYGPNEAGKTTTMEAALRLFYGIPIREQYGFKHQRKNLQVSGQLEVDGKLYRFSRLAKRAGSLVDDNGMILPETAISAHLAGLSEEDYRKLLCLDDETLEQGGDEIAQAQGDIGRLLFSAAAGITDLSNVLKGVREEADIIWRKRASKTNIAELKHILTQVEKDIRESDISANSWRIMKKDFADAQVTENEARDTRDALHAKDLYIGAKCRALPLLLDIEELAERIAPYSTYPERLDFDPESLVNLITEENHAKSDIQRLGEEIEEKTKTRDSVHLMPKLVALSEKLDVLDELRARDVTAGLDLDRRRLQVSDAHTAMELASQELNPKDITILSNLVLSSAKIAQLEKAREVLRDTEAATEAEAREVADLTLRHDETKAKYDLAETKMPVKLGINNILTRYDVDRLAPAVGNAQLATITAQEEERAALNDLAIGNIQFEVLPNCSTSLIKAKEWSKYQLDLDNKIDRVKNELLQHVEGIAARNAQIDQLISRGDLTTDAETKANQDERDRYWVAHRKEMRKETAHLFETSMYALDMAMQSRVSHASGLGQLRQVELELAESRARAEQAKIRLDELSSKQMELEVEINKAAEGSGLSVPISAPEWQDWVQRYNSAVEATNKFVKLQNKHKTDLDRGQKLLQALHPHLNLENPNFDSALTAARILAKTEREAIAASSNALDALVTLKDDLSRRQKKEALAQKHAKQAKGAWCNLVTEFLGDAVQQKTLLASLEPLRDLREHDKKRVESAQRVATMEADQTQFSERVTALATAHDIILAGSPAETFSLLSGHSEAAKDALNLVSNLSIEIEKARNDQTAKQRRLNEINQEVDAKSQIFPNNVLSDTANALYLATSQAKQVIIDRNEKAKLERAILMDLGSSDMIVSHEILDGATKSTLQTEGEMVKADLLFAENQLTEATEMRVKSAQELSQVTGNSEIATLTERKATLELELEELALKHLELSLGHRLADEAIRRYRDTHRSGMMAATERCFAMLTKDAYTHLTTQPDGTSEILLAVNGDGISKRVDELSKGTRFQLYLALRAAAHEQMVSQGNSLPFFCDDIFETFDEDRTSAACRVMEQIGHRGQAIYLTHHQHVVDIAIKVCDTPPTIHKI
ncbi:MAG: AAA family ATPase [Rhizobiales bacterium]|nr:AAA family ATPase [Hyphomicrobiales bacterium]NRB15113.1 AAA family ATPase [Hyphomicrobiales bacterium]